MKPSYTVHPWPELRNLLVEHFEEATKAHIIHALFEADITALNGKLKAKQKERGEGLSINAFIIYTLVQCLLSHPAMTAMRLGRKKVVVFNDIDILTIVERRLGKGISVPVGVILKDIGRLSFYEVNALLRTYQKSDPATFPGVEDRRKLLRYPTFIRRFIFRRISRNPFLFRKYYGNAAVSSLSTNTGNRSWWGIPITAAPVCLMPSGLYKKVVMENGVPAEHDFISITMSMNHDMIDGSPASRFGKELLERLENGYGID